MKRKTLLVFLLITLFSVIAATNVFASSTSVVGTPEYEVIGGKEFVFANGTPITIEERTDEDGNVVEGASITWTGCTESIEVGTGASVFGGMHDNETEVETSVTINGGYVKAVFGGGLHKSNTKSATVVMNDGRVDQINGGGASSWTVDCDCTSENQVWHDGDYEDAPCQTEATYVEINGGTICGISYGIVYGGGCGYANTQSASVSVYGGDLSATYVTAGGSNGNTTNATLYIAGGTIGIVQSVNRGTMEEVQVMVTGGTVENLYVGGETGDAKVTGTISGSVLVEVSGTAEVATMEIGKNGGVVVDPSTDTVIKTENIVVVPGTVKDLANVEYTEKYQVQIDGFITLVIPGTTVKDIPEYDALTEVEGYKFVGLKTADGKDFSEDTKINENLELTMVFEKVEEENPVDEEEVKDEEPKMGVEISTISIFAVVAVIALAGYVVAKKK